MHPVHTYRPCFLKIHSNIILPSTPRSSKSSLYFRFSNHNTVCTSNFPHVIFIWAWNEQNGPLCVPYFQSFYPVLMKQSSSSTFCSHIKIKIHFIQFNLILIWKFLNTVRIMKRCFKRTFSVMVTSLFNFLFVTDHAKLIIRQNYKPWKEAWIAD